MSLQSILDHLTQPRPLPRRKKRRRPARFVVEQLERRALLTTYTVTSAHYLGNSVPLPTGSLDLLTAITEADSHPNDNGQPDVINFNIPGGGVQVIHVGNSVAQIELDITDPVIIDATTQPGYAPGHPVIELDGSQSPATVPLSGLVFKVGGNTVKGLDITNFEDDGLVLDGTNDFTNGQGPGINNTIQNCFIGIDPSGNNPEPNGAGIGLYNSSYNVIGGLNPGGGLDGADALGNLISGNVDNQIGIYDASNNNYVEGDFVGTDLTGMKPVQAPNPDGADQVYLGPTNDETSPTVFPTYNQIGDYDLASHQFQPDGRNIIAGGAGNGVGIVGGAHNHIAGNYIGVGSDGIKPVANARSGVLLEDASDNIVGGNDANQRNIISANLSDGVEIRAVANEEENGDLIPLALQSPKNNVIAGNYIGTDVTGMLPDGNGSPDLASPSDGIELINSDSDPSVVISNNTIGGTDASDGAQDDNFAARNVIANNVGFGVALVGPGVTGNRVQGNFIGTDATGGKPLGNELSGLLVQGDDSGAPQNNIIGDDPNEQAGDSGRNVISANAKDGIDLANGTQSNLVLGNYLGTDATGAITDPDGQPKSGDELGNGADGVRIDQAPDNQIGSLAYPNIISGNGVGPNGGSGVAIVGSKSQSNSVQGNLIGVGGKDAGYPALANVGDGVWIGGQIVGGTDEGAPSQNIVGSATVLGLVVSGGNVISSNLQDGIHILDGAAQNQIAGNQIGTDPSGTLNRGNFGNGIEVDSAPGNIIGGSNVTHFGATDAFRNLIVSNGSIQTVNGQTQYGAGVYIHGAASSGNALLGNYIGIGGDGDSPLGNAGGFGVIISGAPGNVVGGASSGDGNVISRNPIGGVLIQGAQAVGNVVEGDEIGTTADGATAAPNGMASTNTSSPLPAGGVIVTSGAALNVIGGVGGAARNVISGNNNAGVYLVGAAAGNIIQNSYIGLNAAGSGPLTNAPAKTPGVAIENTPDTLIGAASFDQGGNVISGNTSHGIYVGGPLSVGTQIEGNYIGTNSTATAAVPNAVSGIDLASNVTIGSSGPSSGATVSGNTIAGNTLGGLGLVGGTHDNTVVNNNFSTAAQPFIGNQTVAILIEDSPNNTIGGKNAGNDVSETMLPANQDTTADGGLGIHVTGAGSTGNKVFANSIYDNDGQGILIDGGASSNTIGGTNGAGNVIFDNTGSGIEIKGTGTSKNVVLGNRIGVDQDGAAAGNIGANGSFGGNGVSIDAGAASNQIGGQTADAANLISANTGFGVVIDNANNNVIEGNEIGTNPSGDFQQGFGNQEAGIDIIAGQNNMIGGESSQPGAAPGNKLIGNGIGLVFAGGATENFTRGNEIADSQGATLNGVSYHGVGILIEDSSDNQIGGPATADGNSIHDNKAEGVDIHTGNDNSVLHNKIYENAGLGILLEQAGGNHGQQAPTLWYATTGGSYRLAGWLQSAPNATYTIEVFSGTNDSFADGSEDDDAEKLIVPDQATATGVGAFQMVTTNASGMGMFDVFLPADIAAGAVLRATATDSSGNTSEFSDAVTVSEDSDGDGVPDDEENNLDGNSDSASDTAFADALNTDARIALHDSDGTLKDVWSVPNPSPNDAPAHTQFGYGFVSFQVTDLPPDPSPARTLVTLELPDTGPVPTSYWRYGITPDNPVDHWYNWMWDGNPNHPGAEILGYDIVLHFIDGAVGDDDLAVNGTILDAGSPGFPDPFTVVNTNNSGPGSLRQAILNANADPNAYEITFNIPGPAPHAIHLLSPLPDVTRSITIDGFRQPPTGSGPAEEGTTPQVEIDGSQAGPGADGLTLAVDGCVIEGLVIDHFSGDGVRIGPVADTSNFYGDMLVGNTIESNGGYGVEIDDTPYNGVGDAAGFAPNLGNVIATNGAGGVYIHGADATFTIVDNNFIGVAADGVTPLANQGPGVVVDDGATFTLVGESGEGNTIAYNAGPGVEVLNARTTQILANSIFANTGLGIDLGGDGITPNDPSDADSGSNDLQNFPAITSASTREGQTFISGTLSSLPNTSLTIELFASAAADASGYGQGQSFLDEIDATTDDNGQASFDVTLDHAVTAGWYVAATATSFLRPRGGNTSEFSAALQVTATPTTPRVYIVNTPDDVDDATPDPTHFSLREAIEAANANLGQDTIRFDLPDQTRTIAPLTPLPDITDPVVIDGTTQFGYAGLPLVEISGSQAPAGSSGLHVTGGNSVVRGLVVDGFGGGDVVLEGDGGSVIEGNFLGTDVTGTRAMPDGASGLNAPASLVVSNSGDNLIGGTTAAARNLITSLSITGLSTTTTDNRVEGNYIGTDVTGTVDLKDHSSFEYFRESLNYSGVVGVEVGGQNNVIGGLDPGAGNLIANGVQAAGNENVVQGNLIGTDVTGTRVIGQGAGLIIGNENGAQVQGTVIGGASPAARNIIANGMYIGQFVTDTQVQGNYIGTDITGTVALSSTGVVGAGILLEGFGNIIGGGGPGEGNLISGTPYANGRAGYGDGVFLSNDSSGNRVLGNRIGTDVSGTKALGNFGSGVISFGEYNQIGGSAPGEGNLISGNGADGIELAGIRGDAVVGNLIGTEVTGAAALPNRGQNPGYLGSLSADEGVGIYVSEQNVTIGGSTPGAGNVISGNEGDGIRISLTGYNPAIGPSRDSIVVQGNDIGIDVTGTQPVGNGGDGIFIGASTTDTIGGPLSGMGNIIAANGGDGIRIAGRQDASFDYSQAAPGGNGQAMVIQGNKIGTDVTGTRHFGNKGDGISLIVSYGIADDEQIGGTTPGDGNLVAYNGGRGICVPFGNGNVIEGNDIFANGGPALITDINDTLSTYAEQRGLDLPHLAPVLTSAVFNTQGTVVSGTLTGTPFTSYHIDFFADDAVPASGFSDAQTYLQTDTIFIDASGAAQFQLPLDAAVPVGKWISATATSELAANNPTPPGSPVAAPYPSTSALSRPVAVVAALDASDIQFSAPIYLVTENGGSAVVTVTRTGSTVGTATIDYATSDGTALAGANYTATAGTLTFNDGQTTQTITVPVHDDGQGNGNTTFQLLLSDASGASLGAVPSATVPSATVTIADCDAAGQIQFANAAFSVDQALRGQGATFEVTRTGGSQGTVTVDYRVTGGTAIASASSGPLNPNYFEYIDTFGTLTFEDGQSTAEIVVPFGGTGNAYRGPRTVEMTLGNPTGGATLGDLTTSTVTVDDPEDQYGAFTVHSDDASVKESDGKVGFIIYRDGNLTIPATIQYTTVDGTAKAGTNYGATSGTLTFEGTPVLDSSGHVIGVNYPSSAVIWVPIIDDHAVDTPGDFKFVISNPTGGAFIHPGYDSVDMTIVDSDAPQPGSLAIEQRVNGPLTGYEDLEVSETAGSATITVYRTGGSDGTVTVQYATSDGTAKAGVDYAATSGTLTFGPGQTSQTFSVPVFADDAVLGDKTFFVALSDPTGGATLGGSAIMTGSGQPLPYPNPATIDILQDRGAVQFAADGYVVAEANATLTVPIAPLPAGATVDYTTIDGTAQAGTRYTPVSGTLPDASGGWTITVPLINNTPVDGDQTFYLKLTDPTGGITLGPNILIPVSVLDEDRDSAVPPAAVGGFTYSANEGAAGSDQIVATFTDPGGAGLASDYSADIDWGDGTTTPAGAITQDPATQVFSVSGSHTYADEGNYGVRVILHHPGAGDVVVRSKAEIADPSVVGVGGFTYVATVGATPTVQTVATLSDPAGGEPLSEYSADIDWGDGTSTTSGEIGDAVSSLITVGGAHAYAQGGVYPIHVTLHHGTAADTQVTSTATVTSTSTSTTTILTSDHASGAIYGQTVTFTAAVIAGGGTPTGSVDFVDQTTGQDLGSATLAVVNGVDQASVSAAGLSAATHTIVAAYTSDISSFENSQATLAQLIAPATLTVTANNKTKIYGQDNPPLTDTITGFVNGDTISVVTGTADLNTAAASDVGNYTITVGPGTLSAANYTFAFVNGNLSVTPASLTVTADDETKIYGQDNPALTDTITGFVNGDTASAVTGIADLDTPATTASGVGDYPIIAAQGTLSAANYTFAFVNGNLSVTPAALTVTADDKTKIYGQDNPALTDTITGFVNGDTASAVTGIADLDTPATTASGVGDYSIIAAQGTLSAANYTFGFVDGTLLVTPAALTITADDETKIYGQVNPPLSDTITGFVNGDTDSVVTGVADLDTPATAASGVGNYTITAGPGTLSAVNYTLAFVDGTLSVTPASLTVTADDKTKVYGQGNPALTDTITGFVNGDTASAVTGIADLDTPATTASGVGDYPIIAAQGTLSAVNYTFAFADGTLSVTPATLTVTADNKTKVYGQVNPPLSDTITGFVNGDTASAVTGIADLDTPATTASGVGDYTITAGPGTLSAANYTFDFVDGTLLVTPATLTVTADDKTKIYGQDNPALTDTITGFVNGDTASVVTGVADLDTPATAASGVGDYPITAAQGTLSAANYTFAFVDGTLSVTPASLTVTADNKTKVYGQVNPPLTDTITGFVNGDTASAVGGAADLSTTATRFSGVGNYLIAAAPGSLSAANYTFAFAGGTLTINPDTTTTALDAAVFGLSATFTATVTANAPGSGTPTGSVDFFDTTTNNDLGSVVLSGGTASLTATLPDSAQNVMVRYLGGANDLASSAATSVSPLASVYVLNPSASGALSASGNAGLHVAGVVVDDSSSRTAVTANGNVRIAAREIDVVGGVRIAGNVSFSPKPLTGHAVMPDPYAGLPAPSGGTSLGSISLSGNSSRTIQPGVYTRITLSGNARLTMAPGLYVIAGGGFSVTGNAGVHGSEVVIYNAGGNYLGGSGFGAINLSGNGQIALTAPTKGSYAGVLLFQSRDNAQPLSLAGNAMNGLSGALYAANAPATLTGNASSNVPLVVNTLTLRGSASLGASLSAAMDDPPNDPAGLAGVGLPVGGFELSPLASVPLATITSTDSSESASDLTADIDWGDGANSPGTVTLSGSQFTVSGSHTYGDEGSYSVVVNVSDAQAATTVATTAKIDEELLAEGTPGNADQRFISEIYRDVLGRQAEPQGRNYWVSHLERGDSRAKVVQDILAAMTEEYHVDLINAEFSRYLQRSPDPAAMQYFTRLLDAGGDASLLDAILVSSPEYYQLHGGTLDDFADALFGDALGRPVDPAALAAIESRAAQGATRAQIVDLVFTSEEYRRDLVTGWYQHYLDRTPDAAGLALYTAQLDAGLPDEHVIAAMLSSDEFVGKTS